MRVYPKTYRNTGRNDLLIKQEDGSTRPVPSGDTFTAGMHPTTELQLLRGGHIAIEEEAAVEEAAVEAPVVETPDPPAEQEG